MGKDLDYGDYHYYGYNGKYANYRFGLKLFQPIYPLLEMEMEPLPIQSSVPSKRKVRKSFREVTMFQVSARYYITGQNSFVLVKSRISKTVSNLPVIIFHINF